MPQYRFKALNPEGRTIKSETFAQNESDLSTILKEAKLDLISASEMKKSFFFKIKQLSHKEMIFMCIHFHELEVAGVPILTSVADLRDSAETPALKALMIDVYESLKNGEVLSKAFSKHAKIFDPIFIGVLKAGENTGNLGESFKQLEQHYKWVHDLRQKIKRALFYPVTMIFVMIIIILLMMIIVVPQLTDFLQSQNIELPIYTKALIVVSNFMMKYWIHMLVVVVLSTVAVNVLKKVTYMGRYLLDYCKLSTPIFGLLIKKIEIARFCRFFAITYSGGMTVLESLTTCQNVITNLVIRSSINYVEHSVNEGETLTKSLRATGEFPSLVTRMFQVGEEGGNLTKALNNINEFYDSEVNETVNGLIATIQPVLTLGVGLVLLWVTVSVFGPIYSNFQV